MGMKVCVVCICLSAACIRGHVALRGGKVLDSINRNTKYYDAEIRIILHIARTNH